jgi:signal peptidase II
MTNRPTRKSGYVLFAVMAVLGLTLDLWSKHWIFARQGMPSPDQQPIWIVRGILGLETSLNEGALFGLGAGWGVLFIVLSFAAMLGIVYWVFRGGAANDRLLSFALGGILAGILGNLYDRLGLPGLTWTATLKDRTPELIGTRVYAVRDFIHFQYGSFDWPIFNIADSLLVCGVGLLIFHAYVLDPKAKKPAERPREAAMKGGTP